MIKGTINTVNSINDFIHSPNIILAWLVGFILLIAAVGIITTIVSFLNSREVL